MVADLPQLVVGHRCLTRLDFTGCVTASTPNACPRDFDGGFNLSSGDLKLVAAWLDAHPQVAHPIFFSGVGSRINTACLFSLVHVSLTLAPPHPPTPFTAREDHKCEGR